MPISESETKCAKSNKMEMIKKPFASRPKCTICFANTFAVLCGLRVLMMNVARGTFDRCFTRWVTYVVPFEILAL